MNDNVTFLRCFTICSLSVVLAMTEEKGIKMVQSVMDTIQNIELTFYNSALLPSYWGMVIYSAGNFGQV